MSLLNRHVRLITSLASFLSGACLLDTSQAGLWRIGETQQSLRNRRTPSPNPASTHLQQFGPGDSPQRTHQRDPCNETEKRVTMRAVRPFLITHLLITLHDDKNCSAVHVALQKMCGVRCHHNFQDLPGFTKHL